MDVNQHCATLPGLGEEWMVTNVVLDVAAMRVGIHVEYAKKSAICPNVANRPVSTPGPRNEVGGTWTACSS